MTGEIATGKKTSLRGLFNRTVQILAYFLPGSKTLRPFLHRLRGVHINGRIFIGEQVHLENEFPELIEINDGVEIALRCTLMAHFRGEGKIFIGENAYIGPGCMILSSAPGKVLTIEEASVLAAGSVVIKDVPPYTFVGGVPAKPIAKTTVPMKMDTSYDEWKKGLVYLDK